MSSLSLLQSQVAQLGISQALPQGPNFKDKILEQLPRSPYMSSDDKNKTLKLATQSDAPDSLVAHQMAMGLYKDFCRRIPGKAPTIVGEHHVGRWVTLDNFKLAFESYGRVPEEIGILTPGPKNKFRLRFTSPRLREKQLLEKGIRFAYLPDISTPEEVATMNLLKVSPVWMATNACEFDFQPRMHPAMAVVHDSDYHARRKSFISEELRILYAAFAKLIFEIAPDFRIAGVDFNYGFDRGRVRRRNHIDLLNDLEPIEGNLDQHFVTRIIQEVHRTIKKRNRGHPEQSQADFFQLQKRLQKFMGLLDIASELSPESRPIQRMKTHLQEEITKLPQEIEFFRQWAAAQK